MAESVRNAETADPADLLASTGLPEWVKETLAGNGVRRLSEVARMTDKQLLRLNGVGRRTVELLRKEIARQKDEVTHG